nr:MAG TPA: hypothetical protein [Caudoviricetes sp.]
MKRLNKCLFLGCFSSLLSPPSSHRHQQDLWLCFCNAMISIRKRVFHILFFLNLLGLFGQGLSACPMLKKC